VTVPPPVLTRPEPHLYLARVKATLARTFSLTAMDKLYAALELAWCLTALHRTQEARELADHVADHVTFTGNGNIWTPTAHTICLAARLARQEGDARRRAELVGRLVENPGVGAMGRPLFDAWVGDAATWLAEGRQEKSQKWACHKLGRALMRASYFTETVHHPFFYSSWVDVAALERTIGEALAELQQRLGPSHRGHA
jgi:hypothetical protein